MPPSNDAPARPPPPPPAELEGYCRSAEKAARVAGDLIMASLRERQTNPNLVIESKGGVDLVTEVDRQCEECIFQALRTEYPTHHFVGEESTYLSAPSSASSPPPFGRPGEAAPTWICDPIDGTVLCAYF